MSDKKLNVEKDDSFRATIDKRNHRIRYENETEEAVTIVIEPKEGPAVPQSLGDENDCPYGRAILASVNEH